MPEIYLIPSLIVIVLLIAVIIYLIRINYNMRRLLHELSNEIRKSRLIPGEKNEDKNINC